MRHEWSRFRAIPMPAHRYMEQIGSAAILETKKSAGVAPELNLWEHVTHTPPPSTNKAAHSEDTEETSPEV